MGAGFLLALVLLNTRLSLAADADSVAYTHFKEFITKQWRPEGDARASIQEFLQEQLSSLRSATKNSVFWETQQQYYGSRGLFEKAQCIDHQMSALKSTSALARQYIERLEQSQEVKAISGELFDELMHVGRVTQAMTRLHEVISNCMIEVDMSTASVGFQNELYRLGARRDFERYEFRTHSAINAAKRPFK